MDYGQMLANYGVLYTGVRVFLGILLPKEALIINFRLPKGYWWWVIVGLDLCPT